MEEGEIEGVTGDRTFWLSVNSASSERPKTLPLPEAVRASGRSWLMMKYVRPSSTIVMLSVGVRKAGARTVLYIVPETTAAILLLGEVGWIPWTSSD